MTLDALNRLPEAEARATFERCCGSRRWAEAMSVARPFADLVALHAVAESVAAALDRGDWLEAFAAHPKIGDVESLRTRFASTASWAGDEQAGAAASSEDTLQALAEGNRAYEARFGYIFVVCATGKSAAEMLALLRARLGNEPESEIAIAAGEQRKITRLRLDKLLAGDSIPPGARS